MLTAIKFAEGSESIIEGWAAPFDGPFGGRDLDGERFGKSTDFCLDWFETRPVLYDHGLNPETDTAVVGRVKSHGLRDKGLWVQAQLDRASEYFAAIKELVDAGKLFFSSGSMSHLVQKNAKTGLITRWPWVELSLTPTPANLLATLDFATAEKHFKSAGIDAAEFKAAMDAAERSALPDSDFAYIDSSGDRHLPINDAEHVRSALSRFSQTEFASDTAKEEARKKILARAKTLGIAVSEDSAVGGGKSWDALGELPLDQWTGIKLHHDGTYVATKAMEGSYEDLLCDLDALVNPVTPYADCCYSCVLGTYDGYMIVRRYEQDPDSDFSDIDETYWRVEYTLNDQGDPVLGAATQVDQQFVPHKSFTSDSPLTIDAHALARHAGALTQRTKDLHERRIKEGRVLSTVNRQRLADAVKTLAETRTALAEILDASDRMLSDQAKAAALMQPESLRDRLSLLEIFEQTL